MLSVENSEWKCRHYEGGKDADGTDAEHQDRASGAILGQLDRRMRRRVEQVERCFERAVEQFCSQHHAAIDEQQRPPDRRRTTPRQHRDDTGDCQALRAEARFAAPGCAYAMHGKAQALVKRLVFFQDREG